MPSAIHPSDDLPPPYVPGRSEAGAHERAFDAAQQSLGVSTQHTSAATGHYSYDAAVPIKKLSRDQVPFAVKTLEDNATAYMTEGGNIAQQYSTRYQATTRVTQLMRDAEIIEKTSTYAYPAIGQPLALLQVVGQPEDLRIVNLAADPGVYHAGSTMVEHAVRLSDAMGRGGHVTVDPLKGTEPYYESLGFSRSKGSTVLRLEPATRPDKWAHNRQTWHLNDHGSGTYLKADTPLPPERPGE